MRIVLFHSDTESFNYFTDQLVLEFQSRGHETFILDLRFQDQHNFEEFSSFVSTKVELAVCFDSMCLRTEEMIRILDAWNTVVVDILMDPPLRFHPFLEHHTKNYILFCCDLDHVDYVKKYFGSSIANVSFMPHAGTAPNPASPIIPYSKRHYDILFSGTYYRPFNMLADMDRLMDGSPALRNFSHHVYQNLTKHSDLNIEQAVRLTLEQENWTVSEDFVKTVFGTLNHVDWAVRMYWRSEVITVLAESGLELYLLGRGWENHPSASYPNVHRISDRIPFEETLSAMADAKINLNVFPWFKSGTHDRIFNSLLQHSLPLTDSSRWVDETFTDGWDIALYSLKNLEELPAIAEKYLKNPNLAESVISRGYEKTIREFTWKNCVDQILSAVRTL